MKRQIFKNAKTSSFSSFRQCQIGKVAFHKVGDFEASSPEVHILFA